jgi:hypothetical protein
MLRPKDRGCLEWDLIGYLEGMRWRIVLVGSKICAVYDWWVVNHLKFVEA